MRHRLTQSYINGLISRDKPYEVCDEEVTGLRIRVQPTGLKTFYVSYYTSGGKRSRLKLGRTDTITVKNARDQARQVIGDASKGEDPAAKKKALRTERVPSQLESE